MMGVTVMNINNKWFRGAIPALLIHCSIGSVYAWSLFATRISQYINKTPQQVQFAFSLAIFFLGMSAAFGGKLVEHNIKKSSLLSMVFFCSGLVLTSISIAYKSLFGIYIGYGFLMGIGLGIGYITPVKTLMLWFKDQKGLATGIAITGFGFASTIASPLITFFTSNFSLSKTFVLLSLVYILPMTIAHFLIKKPDGYVEPVGDEGFKNGEMFKNKTFIAIWVMLYINISCGLALISVASPIMDEIKLSVGVIATVIAVMGLFNGAGRLIFSAASDRMRDRSNIYKFIFGLSVFIITLTLFNNKLIVIALFVISACYGAGFSNLPSLLSDKFGMKNISKTHGLSLTAWAIAGLTGNQISAFIKVKTGSYLNVLMVLVIAYSIGFLICATMLRSKKDMLE